MPKLRKKLVFARANEINNFPPLTNNYCVILIWGQNSFQKMKDFKKICTKKQEKFFPDLVGFEIIIKMQKVDKANKRLIIYWLEKVIITNVRQHRKKQYN